MAHSGTQLLTSKFLKITWNHTIRVPFKQSMANITA